MDKSSAVCLERPLGAPGQDEGWQRMQKHFCKRAADVTGSSEGSQGSLRKVSKWQGQSLVWASHLPDCSPPESGRVPTSGQTLLASVLSSAVLFLDTDIRTLWVHPRVGEAGRLRGA